MLPEPAALALGDMREKRVLFIPPFVMKPNWRGYASPAMTGAVFSAVSP